MARVQRRFSFGQNITGCLKVGAEIFAENLITVILVEPSPGNVVLEGNISGAMDSNSRRELSAHRKGDSSIHISQVVGDNGSVCLVDNHSVDTVAVGDIVVKQKVTIVIGILVASDIDSRPVDDVILVFTAISLGSRAFALASIIGVVVGDFVHIVIDCVRSHSHLDVISSVNSGGFGKNYGTRGVRSVPSIIVNGIFCDGDVITLVNSKARARTVVDLNVG